MCIRDRLCGDQITDLYNPADMPAEEIRERLSKDFCMLANPTYGSWQSHPEVFFVRSGESTGMRIDAKVGQKFIIVLDSNPTTGYDWEFSGLVPESPVMVQDDVFLPEAPGRMGAGGKKLFWFSADKAGITTLNFEYKRSWEKNVPPLKMKSFEVNVK